MNAKIDKNVPESAYDAPVVVAYELNGKLYCPADATYKGNGVYRGSVHAWGLVTGAPCAAKS